MPPKPDISLVPNSVSYRPVDGSDPSFQDDENDISPVGSDLQSEANEVTEDDFYHRPILHPQLRDQLLLGQLYEKKAITQRGGNYEVTFMDMKIQIKHFELDVERGIKLRVEISEPGRRNHKHFVARAMDNDPAARVAFRATFYTKLGERVEMYPQSEKYDKKLLMQVNTLFDLLKGASLEQIIATPRRFLSIQKSADPRLSKFISPGDFTDGS
ncbi:hypothetical protein BDV30DRAFT_226978 [Aspergillus minisclerotigenes]|uniref:Uncharacterized protein n=1 Tax=Aspergillus minisclerotigenes TaxID=656917 RepID=A0A5N6J268_9EURO|nr:hypothetical protein BDV30DRAFT_226978 [Aspergillus minisclerotigenes]